MISVMKVHFSLLFFPSQKRPAPFEPLERLAAKRKRIVEQRLRKEPTVSELFHKKGRDVAPTLNPRFHAKITDCHQPSNHPGNQEGFPGTRSGFPLMHNPSGTSDTPVAGSRGQEPKISSHQPPQGGSDCAHWQLASSQHRKKKSKKHKDKERERLKDNKGSEWLETSPDLKQKPDKVDSKTPFFFLWLWLVDVSLHFFFFCHFDRILKPTRWREQRVSPDI